MRVVLEGRELPGLRCGSYVNVHVALQVGREPVGLVPADAPAARWETEVTVAVRNGSLEHRGPAVHGKRGERFLYLTWGEVGADGTFTMFRRAKLMLADLGPEAERAALAVGTVALTDARGGPRCARVVPPDVQWTLTG